MRIHYIAPSLLPSRAANSIHVIRMCEAFASLGHDVTLFFRSAEPVGPRQAYALMEYYGVGLEGVRLASFYGANSRGTVARVAAFALRRSFFAALGGTRPDLVVSRNLYAAWVLARLGRAPLVFETHQLETGVRKRLQADLLRRTGVTTVVISKALARILEEYVGCRPRRLLILHDAAPAGLPGASPETRAALRRELAPDGWLNAHQAVAGYFGHLYAGRGIEIIRALADRHPNVAFAVFGGADGDIEACRAVASPPNLRFMGHLPPALALRAMGVADVLLMPYQRSVSIGVHGHDTARWMSPMKMFEYMSSGVPILSSRLPALEEVLTDGADCLMAEPDDPLQWSRALVRLLDDPPLGAALAGTAQRAYETRYNWIARARNMLDGALS